MDHTEGITLIFQPLIWLFLEKNGKGWGVLIFD